MTFNTPGLQELRVTDAANPNITAVNSVIQVIVKTATMLELSGVEAMLAGTMIHVKVRAVDVTQRTLTDYTGTVHFTSSDLAAILSDDATFVPGDAGVKEPPLVLKTAGLQSVSGVDVNNLAVNVTKILNPSRPAVFAFVVILWHPFPIVTLPACRRAPPRLD